MTLSAQSLKQRVHDAKQSLSESFPGTLDGAILLGSGLSDISVDGYTTVTSIAYSDIDGLPKSTAPSHTGELRIIGNGHKNYALCAGRHHLYEGYSAKEVAILPYTLRQLGAESFIVTNAAGALNPEYRPGDVMLIADHINMTGQNPLIGQDQTFGITFPDMSQAYAADLRERAQATAAKQGIHTHSGIYMGVTGPSLETSAERRMFRTLGADAVGMSTVTEVIAANHCGMSVLGLSAITNLALGDANQQPDTIEDVLQNAAVAGEKIALILSGILTK